MIYFTDTDSDSDTTPLARRARKARNVQSTSPTTVILAPHQPFSLVPTNKPSKTWPQSGMSLSIPYSPTIGTPDDTEPEEYTTAGYSHTHLPPDHDYQQLVQVDGASQSTDNSQIASPTKTYGKRKTSTNNDELRRSARFARTEPPDRYGAIPCSKLSVLKPVVSVALQGPDQQQPDQQANKTISEL